jgi:heme-degrading monooxygenase HmoA
MFAVLFEVEPRAERWDDYLRHAGALRPELVQIDGFLDNRRFNSRRHPGRLLSLSLWRDEKSVVRWRTHGGHHAVQVAGRTEVFRDYHLRVGEVVRDNGVVLPQVRLDATEVGAARAASVIEAPDGDTPPEAEGLVDWDLFDGITVPDTRLLLLSWRDPAAMEAWSGLGGSRRLDVRIVRDYGLHARAEAPQYHPPVMP